MPNVLSLYGIQLGRRHVAQPKRDHCVPQYILSWVAKKVSLRTYL